MSVDVSQSDARVSDTDDGSVLIQFGDDEYKIEDPDKALEIAESVWNHATLAMKQ